MDIWKIARDKNWKRPLSSWEMGGGARGGWGGEKEGRESQEGEEFMEKTMRELVLKDEKDADTSGRDQAERTASFGCDGPWIKRLSFLW